ncbi:MAG: tetratricopeptide repeat protein [Thiogranum sp.]|nr:tetratricopeptide repeat protein [Thiogranum sp.]
MKLIFIMLSLILLHGCSSVPEARFDSVAPSQPEAQLLEQARQLFSAGDYTQARARAEQALALNSASAEAWFAVAASWFGMEEYRNSIEAARLAARYRSDLLPDIYLLLGAAHERLDEPWQALRTWRYGSQRYPDNALLHYRLALMYIRLDKPELAADTLKTVLRLEPLNPDPHFQLGMLYADHGYRTPALLALSMALALAPEIGPASLINTTIDALLGIRRTATSDVVHTTPAAALRTDEGDFSVAETALSKLWTARTDRGVDADAPAMLRAAYEELFRILQAMPVSERQVFVPAFYVPVYKAIADKGLADVFINHIFQGRQEPQFRQWLKEHAGQEAQLQDVIRRHYASGTLGVDP